MKYSTKRYKATLEFKDVFERQRFLFFVNGTKIRYEQPEDLKVKVYPKNETEYQHFLAWLFEKEVSTPEKIKEIEERVGSHYKLYAEPQEGLVRS